MSQFASYLTWWYQSIKDKNLVFNKLLIIKVLREAMNLNVVYQTFHTQSNYKSSANHKEECMP